MNLSPTKKSTIVSASLLFLALAGITAGIISGGIFRNNTQDSQAASANITVTDNDQEISLDQSTGITTIERSSTVTVKDPDATHGYNLTAKLLDTTSGITITIGSVNNTTCPVDDPCILTSTPQTVLTTTTNTATETDGDTTTFTTVITIPAEAAISDYVLDIEYAEEATPYAGLIDGADIQSVTRDMCDATDAGTIVSLKDTRDGKYYRVKKMPDDNCWMIDDLAYDINSAPAEGKPAYNPTPLQGGMSTYNNAQYVQNPSYTIPNGGSATASYLYNWCAAVGDTSSNCSASSSSAQYQAVVDGKVVSGTAIVQPSVTGICPAPLRLPKGGPDASSKDPATTANEFAKLDIALDGTGSSRTGANTYADLMSSTIGNPKAWHGVLNGRYYNAEYLYQGTYGLWWTSTTGASGPFDLTVQHSNSYVNPSYQDVLSIAFAVRCVL